MKLIKNLHWFVYALFVLACARQSAPTGGPKDTIPPVLISSNPAHEQINFNGKTIELTFSEMIALNSPKEQLIVTPTIGKDYDIQVRNNRVILRFDKPLQDSTTYTFNFRETVRDVTEKNPARNLKLAISTGTYIDSLSVEGIVFDMMKQKVLKDVTVALQPLNDTFNIFKHQATYFTRSDENGQYLIDNMKPGKYFVYAIADQNKNLVVDSRNESHGFLRDTLNLDTAVTNLDIGLVKLDTRPLKMSSARPFNTYYNIKSTKNLKDFSITSDDSVQLAYTYGADRSNILLYNTFPDRDSLKLNVSLYDSIENKFDTTVYAKFRKGDITPDKFQYQLVNSRILADKGIMNLKFQFSKPLKEKHLDSLFFRVDTLNTIHFTSEDFRYDRKQRTLTVEKQVDKKLFEAKVEPEAQTKSSVPTAIDTTQQPKRILEPKDSLAKPAIQKGKPTAATSKKKEVKNQLFIGRTAFISVEQDSAARSTPNVPVFRTEDMGIIFIEVPKGKDKIIIELVDKNLNIIETVVHSNEATFDDLPPDDYMVRIILDRNGNGIWDAGNYFKKEQPEEVFYYEADNGDRLIKLRANYEHGPLLITY